jgi:hypothetical protein
MIHSTETSVRSSYYWQLARSAFCFNNHASKKPNWVVSEARKNQSTTTYAPKLICTYEVSRAVSDTLNVSQAKT